MKIKGTIHTGDTSFDEEETWERYETDKEPNKKKTDTWYFRQCKDGDNEVSIEGWVQNISMLCMRSYEKFVIEPSIERDLLDQYETKIEAERKIKQKKKQAIQRREQQ